MRSSNRRVLLAKVGLDGHDRGIKIVARGLRDAGFHVIYAGLWQSPEAVVQAVLDEDADWLGISLLSGAHMTLLPRVLQLLHEKGLDDVRVIVGGIIPKDDVPRLKALGVAAVFGPGATVPEIVEFLQQGGTATDTAGIWERFGQKDRRALSRLLSLAAAGELAGGPPPEAPTVVPGAGAAEGTTAAESAPAQPRTIAFTGSGGVGKSSLIGRLVEYLRSRGETAAVLCCDPESPLTHGALLGDRLRISKPAEDPGLFIRSLAAPGGGQAIAPHLDAMARLLHDFGFANVILETVGAGQGDTAVHALADALVVLLQPESGDELQWEKAGLLEVADVVVVHKSDLAGADHVFEQVREQLNLPGCRTVPVLKASAANRQGVPELWQAIENLPARQNQGTRSTPGAPDGVERPPS